MSVVGLACLIWLTARALKRSDDPAKILFKWGFTIPFILFCIWLARRLGPFGPFLIVFMGIILSIMRTPHISEWFSRPLTSLYDGGTEPPEPKPYYSIAQARRQRREFLQAVVAIREQLAKFPNDFEGVMLLAAIYAEHYQRLDLAESELNQLIEMPNQAGKQVAHCLNLLADLQIQHGADYETARGTLEKMIERFPDLAAGEIARARLGRLKLELKGRKETPGVKLGVYERNLGLKHGSPRQL